MLWLSATVAYLKQLDDGLKQSLMDDCRANLRPGNIDVNIMTKVNRERYRRGVKLGPEMADALSALRGFVLSDGPGAVVFSAGMNPRLFSYAAEFESFLPDAAGHMSKKIILKVSDYRSALVINPQTAPNLVLKWAVELEGSVYATPVVEGDAVWIPDSKGYLYRLDAATGAIVWKQKVSDYVNRKHELIRATPFVTDTALIAGTQNNDLFKQVLDFDSEAYMLSIDKTTGDKIWAKAVDKTRAPRITQSAVVSGGRIYVGTASGDENLALDPLYKCCDHRGSMMSLDESTGEILHKEYTIPDIEGLSGGSIWGSTPVIDTARNSVYVTTGNNYSVPEDVEECLQACLTKSCTREEVVACWSRLGDNHIDSIMALDLETLQIKWHHQALPYDAFADPCFLKIDPINCPNPPGPDFDFGQGPTMFTVKSTGQQLVGAAQKSGMYWALDPDTGKVVWSTQVGPGGIQGGSEWGSAQDGERIYVAISNSDHADWEIRGESPLAGLVINRGFWSALDPATGEILWQTPEPEETLLPLKGPKAPVTVAGGVLFGGTTTKGDTDMFALDASTGEILWRFSTNGVTNAGPAVVDGVVYWGAVASHGDDEHDSNYATGKPLPSASGSFFAFCVSGTDGCPAAGG